MRFHAAAVFLLATQSVNGFTLNFGSSNNGVKMMKKTSWGRGLLKMIPHGDNNDNDPVAGAFNDMANDMKKQQDETLQSLRDLSASFKQLAQTDLNNLFGGSQQEHQGSGGAAGGIPAAEESLDTAAPLAGNTFSSPHQHTFYSDAVQVQKSAPPPTPPAATGSSYVESLKQSATFQDAPPAPPAAPAASADPQSSYLDSMSSSPPSPPTGASSSPPGTPGFGGGSSYLDAIQGQASTPTTTTTTTTESFSTSTTSTSQEGGTTAGSSYLDALQGNQAPSSPLPAAETTGVGSSYLDAIAGAGVGAQSSPPQSYAPVSSSATTTAATTAASSGSYLDALQQGSAASTTTTTTSSWASSSQAPPPPPPAAAQPGSYLDSIAGAVSMSQQEGQGISYPPPPPPPQQQQQQQQQPPPVVDYQQQQQPPPQQQPTNPYMGEPTIAYSDPTTPVDATIVDFAPDNEDAMMAGAAPKVETPYQQQQHQPVQRVRTVQPSVGFNPDLDWNGSPPESTGSSDRMSVGAQKVSGYVPDLQGGQGMNGATNIPEPKPKTSRPVFSKKMSGIHSDYDEQVVPPPPPQPTAAGNNNHFNPFSPPPGAPRPTAPMSVFAEKVSGLAADSDMMVNPGSQKAPLTPEPKPRKIVSVAAQRVKDIPDWQNDFAHPTPDVTKPQAPVSVFAKRVKGVPDFNTPNNEESRSSRKPEPPMSVFSQKIKGVADFDANGGSSPPPPPPGSVPRPEPPRSVFAQRVSSNVPRSPPSVAASSGGDFAANGNVPVPNPRVAPPPQQQQQQHQHYGQPPQPYGREGMTRMTGQSNDFSPDFEDAMDAGAPREIPLPDYQNHNTPNHQDHLTNLGSSFLVNPDDRIGSTRDEYLR